MKMFTSIKTTEAANELMNAIDDEISDIEIQIEALQLKRETLKASKESITKALEFEPEPDKKAQVKASRKIARKEKSAKDKKPTVKKSSKSSTVTAQATMTRDQYKEWVGSLKKGSKIDYKSDMKEKLGGDYWCKNYIYGKYKKGELTNLGSGIFEVAAK